MLNFRTLRDLPDITGKRVLVRVEFNVPVKDGVAGDRFRIESAVPTITQLMERKAKVVLIAHLGREPSESLLPVYVVLKELIPSVQFCDDLVGEQARTAIEALIPGSVLLLENLRRDAGEKENNDGFSEKLASFADYFVNDAFGVTHRPAASVVGVPARVPSVAGLLLEREINELTRALSPESPSLLILGGAKFETKEPLLGAALNRYDEVFVGGALANDFFKVQGFEVGRSMLSERPEAVAPFLASGKVVLPIDVTVTGPQGIYVKKPQDVAAEDTIVDCGPETVTELGMRMRRAKFVLWNGPLGNYEKGFADQTESVAQILADSDAHSVVGGGDTVASIRALGLADRYGFLSTGGGAMLDYLVDGKLPGIDALIASPHP